VFPANVRRPDKEDSLSNFIVRKAAVLGAGVMGAQIAAHLANAEVPVVLFDLPAREGDPNGIVRKAIDALKKLEPSPLATKDRVAYIDAANYSQHLDRLKDCDLIIEAIAEKTEWKDDLYRQIAPFVSPAAIIASNTSGLSINRLSEGLPEALRSRFCGIHFFNPPRYMHSRRTDRDQRTTDPALLDNLESWLVSRLGKGIVRAHDTPNFVANRVGVFSMLAVMHHTQRLGLGFDVVDSLTGPIIGRPKSATYRTADVVGLDTLAHVVKTMQDTLPADPWHGYYGVPAWLAALIGKGALGQKTRCGIFRKDGRAIKVLDLALQDYRDSAATSTRRCWRSSRIAIRPRNSPSCAPASIRRRSSCGRSSATSSITPLPSGRHCRQRPRPRFRDALGFRLVAGSVRKLAGRRLAGDCRSRQGRHRRRPGDEPGAAAGLGLWPRCRARACMVPQGSYSASADAYQPRSTLAGLSAADLPRAGAGEKRRSAVKRSGRTRASGCGRCRRSTPASPSSASSRATTRSDVT
jgi:3-hydroxyacyl-CoA dehydrogenase